MSVIEIINKVAETGSTKEKEVILRNAKDYPSLERVFRLSYSKQVQFGIKKVPIPASFSGRITLKEALDFMEFTLATRSLTGNAAIQKFSEVLGNLDSEDREVVRRVLGRDLECGAGHSIPNKVWKNVIPSQPCMLATAYSEKALGKIVFPAYAQLKADGARCMAEITGDELEDVKLLTRAGNEYNHLNVLKQQLIDATREYRAVYGPCMVDGELVWHQVASKKVGTLDIFFEAEVVPAGPVAASRTKSNGIANSCIKGNPTQEEIDGMHLQVWDIIPLSCYNDDKKKSTSDTYDKRLEALTKVCNGFDRLILIETTVVRNIQHAREVYKKYVEQGLEGIILKNILNLWVNKRSQDQVKFKEEITVDMEVIGYYPHRKDPTKLGGITVATLDRRVIVNCGSGFSDTTHKRVKQGKAYIKVEIPLDERPDNDRQKCMSRGDDMIGDIVEIKCNGWVTSEGREGTVGLFLPIYKIWRTDKTQANTFEEAFGEDFTSATGIE